MVDLSEFNDVGTSRSAELAVGERAISSEWVR